MFGWFGWWSSVLFFILLLCCYRWIEIEIEIEIDISWVESPNEGRRSCNAFIVCS